MIASATEAGYNPQVDSIVEEIEPKEGMDDIEKKALRVVLADIETGKRTLNADRHRREEAYKLYRDLEDADNERPGRSKVKSTDVMDMIQWLMPSLMRAFFSTKNCISVSPVGNEDVRKAELLQKLLNWQFMEKGNGFAVGHEWIQSSLIYGLIAAKITWQDLYVTKGFAFSQLLEPQFEALRTDPNVETLTAESINVQVKANEVPIVQAAEQMGDILNTSTEAKANQQSQYNPSDSYEEAKSKQAQPYNPYQQLAGAAQNAMGMPIQPIALEQYRIYENVKGEERIKIYSGPLIEAIPPNDFLYDAEAKTMSDARFAIHRVRRTATYLRKKEKEGIYSNIEEAIGNAKSYSRIGDEEDLEDVERARERNDHSYSLNIGEEQEARRKFNVYEWWGLLDPEDTGIAEPYLVVVCNNTVIRMEKNPYAHGEPPFEVLRPILDVFSLRGISIVDLVGEYQKTKTALMRQMLDNLSWQNNQMWGVDENAGVDLESLANPRPGGIILMENLNGIKQIAPTPLDANAMNFMEFLQGQLEQRTGITRYNQGLDSNTLNKTATGINAIMNASSQRIELIARVMAETGLRPLYKKMLQLDQQFIDQNIVIRVYNEPLEISPDDLAGNFDVSVDIGGATNKEQQEVQQMMTMLQYVPQLSQLGIIKANNVYEIVKKILVTWGISEFDKYITNPQEILTLRQILNGIDQVSQMVQSGQQIDPQQLIQGVMQARQALAQILGVDLQQQQGGNKDPNKTANSLAAREGNFLSYAAGSSQGGPGGGE